MKNLSIQFNAEIIKKVRAEHFQVDQLGSILFILFALYENQIGLLDEFDDYNKQKRAIFLYKELELKGFTTFNERDEGSLYVLSEKGHKFVMEIKRLFEKANDSPIESIDIAVAGLEQLKDSVVEVNTEVPLDRENPNNWIDDWLDLFPKGVRTGGKFIRSDKLGCLRKMVAFMKEYEFKRDTIMEATRRYLNERRQVDWAYTRCATYFISRADGNITNKVSDLASWCEDVISNPNSPSSTSNNGNNGFEIMV